ncbi:MAG: FAD-dependent oxidoreductase [Acidimicrobiales bacterium]
MGDSSPDTVGHAGPITAEVAVIGLGLIGSAALRELATDGRRVVGIGPAEPAELRGHDGPFASHYDSGRITRHLDARREWAVLAARAIAGYADLEAASGISFHRPAGVVLAERDERRIGSITSIAAELGVALTVTPTGDAPAFDRRLSFPDGSTLLSEPAPAGHVDPRRMLAANLTVAEDHDASILREPAVAIEHGMRWRVRTAGGAVIEAERLVVATGAHSDELVGLAGCPAFMVRGETIVMATLPEVEQARLAGLPSVLARLDHPDYEDLYMVPPTTYPDGSVRLKLGATLRHVRRLDHAAERRTWMSGDDHLAELGPLRDLLTSLVPGLVADAWETRPCLITDTASEVPVVDHVMPGLVLAAGGNGFAAKSANAIGALAARLSTDGRWTDPDLDARVFAATRISDR